MFPPDAFVSRAARDHGTVAAGFFSKCPEAESRGASRLVQPIARYSANICSARSAGCSCGNDAANPAGLISVQTSTSGIP